MKKNYLLIIILLFSVGILQAAVFTINPTGNLTYNPAMINASVGDTVIINASGNHPVVQVSQSTWNANGNTPIGGGFGPSSSAVTLHLMNAGTIYFVCNTHHGSAMKGQINVTAAGVSELSSLNFVRITTNPSTNGEIKVVNTLSKSGTLYIFNILGKLSVTKQLNSDLNQVIDVDLPAGNYLCRFMMEGSWTRTEKLVISTSLN